MHTIITVKSLQKTLKNNLNKTKRLYKNLIQNQIESENDQILYDNFYLIEKTTKILLNENHNLKLPITNRKCPILGELILNSCEDSSIPDTDDLITLFKMQTDLRYVSSTEFELLIWSFRYSIIMAFADIYLKNKSGQHNALDLIVLLTMSDSIDTEQITLQCNPLEILYSQESTGIYVNMDETTKRMYRTRTSAIAAKEKTDEIKKGISFLTAANNCAQKNIRKKECHIGYYIEKEYNNVTKRISVKKYLLFITILTVIFEALFTILTKSVYLWIFTLLPLWELSRIFIEIIFTSKNEITFLPRMENEGTISKDNKTLMLIATLISSPNDIIDLQDKLIQLHFLNNTDNLKICALCDLKQSDLPINASDNKIKNNCTKMINALNKKYGDYFILVIRNRTFSKTQGIYTGFDRKRGAIEQLVRYIKNEKINFLSINGDTNFLKEVKYLICLDYDTKPLMDTAASLVAIASHPLNVPEINNGYVTDGYGILTPKITTKLKSSLASRFAKLAGGTGSSCAYDTICANLYQDTFDEGIFTGKGLIDVNAFYQICCDIFPHEEVLSHDILEGELLRTGFASDVEFSDNFPLRALSYFKRMHRWIRGDIQNISYIFRKIKTRNGIISNPFLLFSKYKLADNIKRAILPVNIILLFAITFFNNRFTGCIISIIALLTILLPYIFAFFASLRSNGFYNLSRKFYYHILSQTSECISQGLFSLLILPITAVFSFDAIIRALYRKYVSHKKLLEWTTAAQAENQKGNFDAFTKIYLPNIALGLILILTPVMLLKFAGLLYIFSPIIIKYIDTPYKFTEDTPDSDKATEIISQLSLMWQFYEDYCTAKENYLPPDNVQFSPVFRICHRTSPTNIGLMMLSALVARDFDLIDSSELSLRISRTLDSVEKLEKYKGNLYNWYETKTLKLSNNPFVSTVDSGNFVCCLVALKEGLKDYQNENYYIGDLIVRINKIINNTDLSTLFNKKKKLFSIGYNPITEKLSPNHYDMLMSEARMTSYFAIAKRIVPKSHWRALGRVIVKHGLYSGPISYSGTMFEFFMPELLLNSEKGSLSYEGLQFCLHCQKNRAKLEKTPFGISESGYFAFDNALNYQYKAHGVQKAGLKRGLDNDLVISPYSSYLAIAHDFDNVYYNLMRLNQYGMMGSYGFYEAIDLTSYRGRKQGSIIKSYMAHHVGMSIIGVSNALQDKKMQKRFLNDNYMKSADELLSEKVLPGTVMLKDLYQKPETQRVTSDEPDHQIFDRITPISPEIKLLSNSDYTLILADNGCSIALYQNRDVYLRTTDLLRKPEGCYFAFATDEKVYPLTYLPDYTQKSEQFTEFTDNTVSYYYNTDNFKMSMTVFLHNNLPCEIRKFSIKNISDNNENCYLAAFIQPVLAKFEDNACHPAFCKLFLKMNFDISNKIIYITRKNRHNDEKIYCAIGFIEDINIQCNLSRDEILNYPSSVVNVFDFVEKFSQNYNSIPDPAVFIRAMFSLNANEQKDFNMFILTGLSEEEIIQGISKIKYNKIHYTDAPTLVPSSFLESRLLSTLLPKIFFKHVDNKEISLLNKQDNIDISSLWGIKISGDLPIIIVNVKSISNNERITAYIKSHNILKICGIKTDLVFTYNEKDSCDLHDYIFSLIKKENSDNKFEINGGIFLINTAFIDEKVTNLLFACAIHIAPQSIIKIPTQSKLFTPIKIQKISNPDESSLLDFGFNKDSFYIKSKTPVPWCNILANPTFGTLLSNNSLGFTYAVSSRENKLTAWENDAKSDNTGEMLLIKIDGEYYDLISGSTAIFSTDKCEYYGSTKFFDSCVTVTIANKGMCKLLKIEITPKENISISLAYYIEPILGVSKSSSSFITFLEKDNILFAHNSLNREVKGYMGICTLADKSHFITDRESFLSGKWNEQSIKSNAFPCSAIIVEQDILKNDKFNTEFYMSFGRTVESAQRIIEIFKPLKTLYNNSITIDTPDNNLNHMFNTWLMHQTVSSRINARTGFYQNSGAWGFRDQLQDSCAALLLDPAITQRQIFRCCYAQFIDGDVLHWWHKLPSNVMRGVRTKYSDDLVWLPYTVCQYIQKTNNYDILSKNIAYCEGLTLNENQHEIYGEVKASKTIESVYNHCKRALDHAFRLGKHNLILMGCGDWNDSFNGVGIEGKGESVWLSEFMIIVLNSFAQISSNINDIVVAENYKEKAKLLSKAISDNCWDGEWFIRAYFDDGEELGSKDSKACIIDSLPQSFAVLSELDNDERNEIALNSAYEYLVDKKNSIIKLYTPPFANNEMPVGYATSYPAGIRENGGQYTHAAIWLVLAFFKAQNTKKGYELLKLLNPANKYEDEKTAKVFKNEPYFMTADIYTNPQCYGRGGWSIYTGAAAWYYRAILEGLCGLTITDNKLYFAPHLPDEWDSYEVNLKYNYTKIHITILRGNNNAIFDNDRSVDFIELDQLNHEVRIIIKKQ